MFKTYEQFERERGRLGDPGPLAPRHYATYALLRCECDSIQMTPKDTGLFNCRCRHSGMGKNDSMVTDLKIREIQSWEG